MIRYTSEDEGLVLDRDAIVSDDHVKALDKELAPYPLAELDDWKALTGFIEPDIVDQVIGPGGGLVDGLSPLEGGDGKKDGQSAEMAMETGRGSSPVLHFTSFRLKKSWKEGSVGEEVTRYSRDKSWLFGDLCRTAGGELMF